MFKLVISSQYLEALDLYFLWMLKLDKADNESDTKYCTMNFFWMIFHPAENLMPNEF